MLLAVSKNGWDSLPAREQRVMRWLSTKIELGVPARFVNRVTQARWYVFDDRRIRHDTLTWFGVFAANAEEIAGLNLAQFPANATKEQIKNFIYSYLQARRVAPADCPRQYDFLSPQDCLNGNGAPLALRAYINELWDSYDPEIHGEW